MALMCVRRLPLEHITGCEILLIASPMFVPHMLAILLPLDEGARAEMAAKAVGEIRMHEADMVLQGR